MEHSLPSHSSFPSATQVQQSNGHNISKLTKEFLEREQASKAYQGQLEFRWNEYNSHLQQERYRCGQLEEKLVDAQWRNGLLEARASRVSGDIDMIRQELATERTKSQDLDSRATTLFTINDLLVKSLAEAETAARHSEDEPLDVFAICLENMKNQETIKDLQMTIKLKEGIIETLQETIRTTFGCCSSTNGSDGGNTFLAGDTYTDVSLPAELPVEGDVQVLDRPGQNLAKEVMYGMEGIQ